MMKILDRYLFKRFTRAFFFLVIIFEFLFGFLEFLSELDEVGRGSYTLLKALFFVFFTSGNRFFDLLPIVSLLAGLSSLGSLADRNELLAMQASGMSRFRIGLVIILTLSFILLVGLGLEEWVFPQAGYRAWLLKAKALSTRGITPYREGFWAKEDQVFIRVAKVLDNQMLSGLSIFYFNPEGELETVIEAPLGRAEEDHWLLWSATKRNFSLKQIREEKWPRLEIPAFLRASEVEVLAVPSDFLSIQELWRYREALKQGGQNVYQYSLLIWQKIAVPFTALVMGLLSLGFVFGPVRERGVGFRLSLGALIGLFVYLGKEVLSHVGVVFAISAPVVALFPAGLIFILALWRLRCWRV